MEEKNVYQPYLMRIAAIIDETPDVKTFRLEFINEEEGKNFKFMAGQFGEYSVFGEGESTFCIASSPTREGYIECTFRKMGRVTKALASREVGDTVGFRGPYGNTFPIDQWKGKSLLFVTGGIALPPLRCVIWNALDLREQLQGRHHRVRRPLRQGPGVQARARGVGQARRREAHHHGRPGRRDQGVEGRGRLRPDGARESGALKREHHRAPVRPAHHDQAHHAGPDQARLLGRTTSSPPWRTG